MRLPQERGPLSAGLIAYLRRPASDATSASDVWGANAVKGLRRLGAVEILADADVQLSLWMLYELHYQSFSDVDDGHEWLPATMGLTRLVERPFEMAVRSVCADAVAGVLESDGALADRLFQLAATFEGPALAEHVQRRATREQVRELLLLRSVYHLKEADPHSWAIPRLRGAAKAGLVELQFDEYGDGHADRVHQDLFRATLRGAGLDDTYGAYVADAPAETLVVSNVMTLFGLHRRLRGAAMGHLATFEATSSVPCRRYAAGLRRVGFSDETALYFDEHVEADAVHEQLAVRGVCTALVEACPDLEADVVFGAVACLELEARAAAPLLAAWEQDRHLVHPPPESSSEPDSALAVSA